MQLNLRAVVLSCCGWLLGLGTGVACGPERAEPRCYGISEIPLYDPEEQSVWICDIPSEEIPDRFPEYSEDNLVLVRLPRDGPCPACADELDPIFFAEFEESVDNRGLDLGFTRDCLDDGYGVNRACLDSLRSNETTCYYVALLETNCRLSPYIPSLP